MKTESSPIGIARILTNNVWIVVFLLLSSVLLLTAITGKNLSALFLFSLLSFLLSHSFIYVLCLSDNRESKAIHIVNNNRMSSSLVLWLLMHLVLIGIISINKYIILENQISQPLMRVSEPVNKTEEAIIAAAIQAQASIINTLFSSIAIIITGIGITLSIIVSNYDKSQSETLHRKELENANRIHLENYRKNLLEDFQNNQDVLNFKNVIEFMTPDSTTMPYIKLNLPQNKSSWDKYFPISSAPFEDIGQSENIEIIPPLQVLVNGISPRGVKKIKITKNEPSNFNVDLSEDLKYSLIEAKMTRSLDKFLEYFILISKLAIENNSQSNSITDIKLWWDSIDLPYWSRLIIFGEDNIPTSTADIQKTIKALKIKHITLDDKNYTIEDFKSNHRTNDVKMYTNDISLTSTPMVMNEKEIKLIILTRFRHYISYYYPEVLFSSILLSIKESEIHEEFITKLLDTEFWSNKK